MKERQLERAEIAKAALQTDEAESQLIQIKREFVAYKGQSQEELKTMQVMNSIFFSCKNIKTEQFVSTLLC